MCMCVRACASVRACVCLYDMYDVYVIILCTYVEAVVLGVCGSLRKCAYASVCVSAYVIL